MSRTARVLIALAALVSLSAVTPAQGPYRVIRTAKIGGDGGFDYITADPANRTLYIARSGAAGHVGVYNLDTLAQVGDIAGASGHGATVDDATGHGFITSKPVTMFDAKTFTVIKKIEVQGSPDGYLDDPFNSHVYILSHAAPNVTIVDARDGAILSTVDIGGAPEQAVSDGMGHIYVDIEDKDAIAVIDATTMKMTGKFDVSSKGGGCAGLAIDAKNGILFATCRDKKNMIIVSAKDGHVIADLPIGSGSDGASFNPGTMEAFAPAGDGTLTVVKENSPTSFAVEQTVTTLPRAKVCTVDPKTGRIYTDAAEYGPPPVPPAGTAPVPGGRAPRAAMIPGSFQIIVIGR
jgi:DNA-binding beta-propeller fold protein YncE